jgi:hypothetical protein
VYPFIQTGSIAAADKFITEFTQTLNEDGLRISKLFPADTIVMTITGAKIAEVAVTAFEACFPDSIVGFIPDHRLVRDYPRYQASKDSIVLRPAQCFRHRRKICVLKHGFPKTILAIPRSHTTDAEGREVPELRTIQGRFAPVGSIRPCCG